MRADEWADRAGSALPNLHEEGRVLRRALKSMKAILQITCHYLRRRLRRNVPDPTKHPSASKLPDSGIGV